MNSRPWSEDLNRRAAPCLSGVPLMPLDQWGQKRTFPYREPVAGDNRPLPTTRESLPQCGRSIDRDLESHAFAGFRDVPANWLGQQLGTWDRTGRRGWWRMDHAELHPVLLCLPVVRSHRSSTEAADSRFSNFETQRVGVYQ